MRGDPGDDGPRRFVRRWLSFDETRLVRTRLVAKFVAVIALMLLASALLALLGHLR